MFIRSLITLLALVALGSMTLAQGPGEPTAMRFVVAGVDDRDKAKPIQYHFLSLPGVTRCDYIPECGCFKLAGTSIDPEWLAHELALSGHALSGPVYLSNGQVHHPPAVQPVQR